jgi:hypothetical protein
MVVVASPQFFLQTFIIQLVQGLAGPLEAQKPRFNSPAGISRQMTVVTVTLLCTVQPEEAMTVTSDSTGRIL